MLAQQMFSVHQTVAFWTGQTIFFTSCLQYFIYLTLPEAKYLFHFPTIYIFLCTKLDPQLGLVFMGGGEGG